MLYLLKRAFQTLLVLFLVGTIAFAALHLAGDPVSLLVAEDATPIQREDLRRAYGLEQSVIAQYFIFLKKAAVGDLGNSFYSSRPAMPLLLERLPATLQLVSVGLGLALLLGVPLGISSAIRIGTAFDRQLQTITAILISAPTFWIGILLIQIFAVQWRVLPSQGSGTIAHLILPAMTLALPRAAVYTQMLRVLLLEVLSQDFIRTAHAKGVYGRRVVYNHALRNALVPFVTVLGLQFAGLLSGAVITESLFAYPGMNRVALEAIGRLDIPVILAFVLLSALIYASVNFLTDVAYVLIDPRVRYD